MKYKIEEEKSCVINVEKINRITIDKVCGEEVDFCVTIFLDKDYTRFYFPTFEIAERFSDIVQKRFNFKGSSIYTPFIDVVCLSNDLLKKYFKENEKSEKDESVYYKSNNVNYES